MLAICGSTQSTKTEVAQNTNGISAERNDSASEFLTPQSISGRHAG